MECPIRVLLPLLFVCFCFGGGTILPDNSQWHLNIKDEISFGAGYQPPAENLTARTWKNGIPKGNKSSSNQRISGGEWFVSGRGMD